MSTDSDRLRRQRLLVAADWMWVLATLSAIAVILCAWKIHDVKTAPDPPPPPLCPLDCSACGDASCGVAIDDDTCGAFGLFPVSERCSGANCCDGTMPFYDLEAFSSCGWDDLYSNDIHVGCDCSRCASVSSSGQATVCGYLPTTDASGVNCDPDLCADYISGTCQLSKVEDLCNCKDCCGGVAGLCPLGSSNYTEYWNRVQGAWCDCTTCDFASTCEGLLDADCGASSCYLTTTLCSSGGYFPNDACGFCASGFMTTPWMQCVKCYEDSDCTDASKVHCQNQYTTIQDDYAYECVECIDSSDCTFETCDECDDDTYSCIPGGKCDPCSCELCNGDGSCTKVCAPDTYCWSGYVDSTLGIDTSCDETKHDASNAFSNCHLNTETMWCYTECASDADCATATVFDYYDDNDDSSKISAPFCDMTTHTCQVCDFSQTECASGGGQCYRIVDVDSSNLCAETAGFQRAPPSTNQCFASRDEYCKTLSDPLKCKKTTKNTFCPSDAALACDGDGTTIMVDLSGNNLCLSSCSGDIYPQYCAAYDSGCENTAVCSPDNGKTCGTGENSNKFNTDAFCKDLDYATCSAYDAEGEGKQGYGYGYCTLDTSSITGGDVDNAIRGYNKLYSNAYTCSDASATDSDSGSDSCVKAGCTWVRNTYSCTGVDDKGNDPRLSMDQWCKYFNGTNGKPQLKDCKNNSTVSKFCDIVGDECQVKSEYVTAFTSGGQCYQGSGMSQDNCESPSITVATYNKLQTEHKDWFTKGGGKINNDDYDSLTGCHYGKDSGFCTYMCPGNTMDIPSDLYDDSEFVDESTNIDAQCNQSLEQGCSAGCCKKNGTTITCDTYAWKTTQIGYCEGHDCKYAQDGHYDEVTCKNTSSCTWVELASDDATNCKDYCGAYANCGVESTCSAYDRDVTACDTEDLGCGWSCVDATPEPA